MIIPTSLPGFECGQGICPFNAKRLGLLHEVVPKAVRVAVLVNPANVYTKPYLPEVEEAARAIGLQTHVLNASTSSEIDAAFAALARERPDALFVATDTFFFSRRVQIAILAARERIPAAFSGRDHAVAGGLMSYDPLRQVGTGRILKGDKPADLPVQQATWRGHQWKRVLSRIVSHWCVRARQRCPTA
jgi:putative ABC transport system substrate-binding protein